MKEEFVDIVVDKQREFSSQGLFVESFHQRNVKASRKQIAPEVIKFEQMFLN